MFVFSNLAISLDGKIATETREPFYLGTPADRAQMQVLRKRADVLLMGATTLRTYKKFCGIRGEKPTHQIANAILSSRLEGISPSFPFFENPEHKRLLFVTAAPSTAKLRALGRSSEIIPLTKGRVKGRTPVARQIVSALKKRGFKRLLVEGGGSLMWDFASQNLIDEYHVTLTPKIVGGRDAPTLVEGGGFSPAEILGLKLKRCRRLGDELYLTYTRL